jgi:thymidylate synthase (FAD)
MNTVERIQNTFTDRFIADCARCSFGTTAEDYSDEQVAKLIDYLVRNRHVNPMFHPMVTVRVSVDTINKWTLLQQKNLLAGLNMCIDGDSWLITTSAWGLMELTTKHMECITHLSDMPAFSDSYNEHHAKKWNDCVVTYTKADTPRHHQWFTFRFDTELATKAQLYTHTVGLAKSSQSFRYVDDIRFYVPPEWRGKAENVKQGSSDEVVQQVYGDCPENGSYRDIIYDAERWYNNNNHICNEQRRYILPQAQMSRYVITGTREAWERVIRLRCDPHAQKEIRLLIEQVADLIASDKEWA